METVAGCASNFCLAGQTGLMRLQRNSVRHPFKDCEPLAATQRDPPEAAVVGICAVDGLAAFCASPLRVY